MNVHRERDYKTPALYAHERVRQGEFGCNYNQKECPPPNIWRCCRLRSRKPAKGYPKVAFQSGRRFSIQTANSSEQATIAVYRTTTLHCMARLTPSATRDASAAIARSSWSRRWRLAGIAVDWCGSLVSAQ